MPITVLSIEQYQDYLFAIFYELSVHDTITLTIDHIMQLKVFFLII